MLTKISRFPSQAMCDHMATQIYWNVYIYIYRYSNQIYQNTHTHRSSVTRRDAFPNLVSEMIHVLQFPLKTTGPLLGFHQNPMVETKTQKSITFGKCQKTRTLGIYLLVTDYQAFWIYFVWIFFCDLFSLCHDLVWVRRHSQNCYCWNCTRFAISFENNRTPPWISLKPYGWDQMPSYPDKVMT